jgi:hypothetical protein
MIGKSAPTADLRPRERSSTTPTRRDAGRPHAGEKVLAAPGGRGGRGNWSFATSVNQAPDTVERGGEGVERRLGSSSSSSPASSSSACPTREIHPLSRIPGEAQSRTTPSPTLVARPGGCPTAREFSSWRTPPARSRERPGRGSGHRFLKHVERTEGQVHVLDAGQARPHRRGEPTIRAGGEVRRDSRPPEAPRLQQDGPHGARANAERPGGDGHP